VSYEQEVNFHGVGRRWISATYTPTFDSAGAADGWVAVVWDITERKRGEESLRASEERLRAVSGQLRRFLDTTATGLVRYDRDLRYLEANAAYAEMVGLAIEQIVGSRLPDMVGPQGWAKIRSYVDRVLAGESVEFDSTVHYARTGSRQVHVVYTPERDDCDQVTGWVASITDVTERKAMEDRLRLHRKQLERQVEQRTSEVSEANRQLSLLTTRLLQLQDHERRRLARELHDSAGQLLTALGMNLYRLRRSGQLNEENERILSDADVLLQNAAGEIRTISHLLHPPLLDEKGLSTALESYVQGFEERSGIKTRLELPQADLERLPAEIELAIYRIVQEALTNVHRHSGSATATVRLVRSSDEVRLEIVDQGRGIPLEQRASLATDASKGVGLRAIRERIAQLGGTLELRTDPSGTAISLKLPVAGAALAVSSK
jgi:PAS domain S-box-containing protein